MNKDELNSERKIKAELKKLDRYALYIGGAGMFFLFVFTIAATQFHLWFDFTNTGQIGDTIGGLTTPIIGIFSALLIYLSFRAQIKANYIVQSQIEKQENSEKEKKEMELITNLLNELNKEINSFVYRVDHELKIGADALIHYLNDHNFTSINFEFNEFDFYSSTKNQQYLGLLDILDKLIQIIIESVLKPTDKEYFKAQLQYLVKYKLTLCEDQSLFYCDNCKEDHVPLPCVFIERFKLIDAKIDFIVPG